MSTSTSTMTTTTMMTTTTGHLRQKWTFRFDKCSMRPFQEMRVCVRVRVSVCVWERWVGENVKACAQTKTRECVTLLSDRVWNVCDCVQLSGWMGLRKECVHVWVCVRVCKRRVMNSKNRKCVRWMRGTHSGLQIIPCKIDNDNTVKRYERKSVMSS